MLLGGVALATCIVSIIAKCRNRVTFQNSEMMRINMLKIIGADDNVLSKVYKTATTKYAIFFALLFNLFLFVIYLFEQYYYYYGVDVFFNKLHLMTAMGLQDFPIFLYLGIQLAYLVAWHFIPQKQLES